MKLFHRYKVIEQVDGRFRLHQHNDDKDVRWMAAKNPIYAPTREIGEQVCKFLNGETPAWPMAHLFEPA